MDRNTMRDKISGIDPALYDENMSEFELKQLYDILFPEENNIREPLPSRRMNLTEDDVDVQNILYNFYTDFDQIPKKKSQQSVQQQSVQAQSTVISAQSGKAVEKQSVQTGQQAQSQQSVQTGQPKVVQSVQ